MARPTRVNDRRFRILLAAGAAIVALLLFVRSGDFLARPSAAVCSFDDRVVDVDTLTRMGGLAALGCFGDATLTLEGTVRCTPLVRDGGPGGPSWLDPYSGCALDEALALYGRPVTALLEAGGPPPPDPVSGRYLVRGHFDDPEARTCSMLPIGVSVTSPIGPPDPEAVLACRQMFVVTDVQPLS